MFQANRGLQVYNALSFLCFGSLPTPEGDIRLFGCQVRHFLHKLAARLIRLPLGAQLQLVYVRLLNVRMKIMSLQTDLYTSTADPCRQLLSRIQCLQLPKEVWNCNSAAVYCCLPRKSMGGVIEWKAPIICYQGVQLLHWSSSVTDSRILWR